jgi:hypothetical protein
MNAVNSIDELKEAKRLQQALRANPNDIDSQLKLAAKLTRDLDLKRKVLNRILTLEPANKTASEMLLEMDRVAIGGDAPERSSTVILPHPPAIEPSEKPLKLRYSIIHRLLVYPVLAVSILLLFMSVGEWDVFGVFAVFFLLLLIPLWFVSAVLEVSSMGLHLSRLFGVFRREMEWIEIQRIEPGPMGVGMKLSAADGRSLMVSSQLHGYSSLVKILNNARPDLFEVTAARIFQKSFLAKYGLFFFLVPATPLALGGIFVPPFLPGILITLVIFFLWRYALQAVYLIQMDQNRLSTRSFVKSREFSVQQIRNIDIVTVRNRRGVAQSLVQIEFTDASKLTLSGFPEGNELLYGFMKNWWQKNKNS